MPRTRNQAAAAIAESFLPLERSADQTAAQAYRCVATIMEQRTKAKVSPLTGNEAIELLRQGADHAARARECFMKVHAELAELSQRNGLSPSAFGDSDECKTFTTTGEIVPAALKLVG